MNGGEIISKNIAIVQKAIAKKVPLKPEYLDPARKVFTNTLVIRSQDLENGEAFGHMPTRLLVDILSFNAYLYYYCEGGILSDGVYDRLFKHLKLRYKKGQIPKSEYYYLPDNLFEQDHPSFTRIEDTFLVSLAQMYYNNPKHFGRRSRNDAKNNTNKRTNVCGKNN